ncbi:hypothetical protein BH09VER1_BH09VER1_18280 [soil metagenome]
MSTRFPSQRAQRILGTGVALLLILLRWAGAAEAPPLGATFIPAGSVFRDVANFRYRLVFEDKSNTVPIRSADLIIRNEREDLELARVPDIYGLTNRSSGQKGWRDGLSSDDLRRIGELPTGTYHMALLLNGVRASNVIAVRIDPKFDPLTAPTFEIGAVEGYPGGKGTRPVIWTIGPTPGDKRISNMSIYVAPLIVDGMKRTRMSIVWTGPVGLIRDGDRWAYMPELADYGVEPGKAHTYSFELAGRSAKPVMVDPADNHLGEEWDKATVATQTPPVPLLRGKVTASDGAADAGYKVWLRTRSRTIATEYTGTGGEYAFAGVPPGSYQVYAAPMDKGNRSDMKEVTLEAGKTEGCDLVPGRPVEKKAALPMPTASPAGLRYIDLAKVEATLGKGLDVNERAQDGNTPVAIAAMVGKLELVKRLVEAGADVNAQIAGNYTVLRRAMGSRNVEVLEYLISKGARVNELFPGGGGNPLMVAAGGGEVEVAKLFLDHGADAKMRAKDGKDALILAAQRGHDEVITLLVAHGAEVNRKDKDGMTALMWAAQVGQSKTVEALIQSGADVNGATQDGCTALFLASAGRAKDRDYAGVVRALLAAGAKPSAMDAQGMTPLVCAAGYGATDRVEALVKGGADIKGEEGRKALAKALREKQYSSLEALLMAGANPDAVLENHRTGLFQAVYNGDTKAVEILLKAKANPNATELEPGNESTVLMAVARGGNLEIVNALLAAGAKADFKDDRGKTAADYAREAGKREVAEVLKTAEKE